MKNRKKIFDTVQMVREIRDAQYRQKTDPNFDPKGLQMIKEKWTKRLKEQERISNKESKFA